MMMMMMTIMTIIIIMMIMMVMAMTLMINQDYTFQAALKRLAFPAEAQECIWRVGSSTTDQIYFKETRLNCSVCQSFLFQGARLSPPSWQHPLQCTRQGGDRGDHYHSHAHDYDNHDH